MTGYGGYFLQGLSGGLQQGFNMTQQIKEMKWKREEKAKAKKAQDDFALKISDVQTKAKQYAEGGWTGVEVQDFSALMHMESPEVQDYFKGLNTAIADKDKKRVEEWHGLIKEFGDSLVDLDYEHIEKALNDYGANLKQPDAIKYFETYKKSKLISAKAQKPKVEQYTSLADARTAAAKIPDAEAKYDTSGNFYYVDNKDKEATESVAQQKYNESKRARDAGEITDREFLRVNLGFDPDKLDDKQLTGFAKKYDDAHKYGKLLNVPSEEIDEMLRNDLMDKNKTPKMYNASEVLYGDNGILSAYENLGKPLNDRQKIAIRYDFEKWKPALEDHPDDLAAVINVLLKIGIDVNTPPPEIKEKVKEPTWAEKQIEKAKKTVGKIFSGSGNSTIADEIKNYREKTTEDKKDKYGYVLDEIKEIDGKKWKYIGDNKWKQIF